MGMTDGNPDKGNEQKVVATVDPMQVAQLVRQLQKQDQQQVQQESRFQKKINSLLSTNAIDKDNLNEITELVNARTEDLKEELKSQGHGSQTTNQRYAEAVADAIENYVEGDEALEAMRDHLRTVTLKKLGQDSAVMMNFNSNVVDKGQVKQAAKAAVEEFSKNILKRDKSGKGPAINTNSVPGTTASKAIENSSSAGSIDDITEPHRRESYHKLNALFLRNKMSKEDAHNKAYAAATKQYKKAGTSA